MNPYVLAGLGVALLVSHASVYMKGVENEGNKQKAAYAQQLEKAIAEHNANAVTDMEAALEVGKSQAKVRTVIREVERKVATLVDRPVYRECRIDDDGLRLWNAANAGSEAPSAGKPDPTPAKLPRIE